MARIRDLGRNGVPIGDPVTVPASPLCAVGRQEIVGELGVAVTPTSAKFSLKNTERVPRALNSYQKFKLGLVPEMAYISIKSICVWSIVLIHDCKWCVAQWVRTL